MDFEEFASQNGGARQQFGEAGLHRNPGQQSQKVWGRKVKAQMVKDAALAGYREELRATYDALVTAGELRPRTNLERMVLTARGHDDNENVQAARRVLTKRGIEWKE